MDFARTPAKTRFSDAMQDVATCLKSVTQSELDEVIGMMQEQPSPREALAAVANASDTACELVEMAALAAFACLLESNRRRTAK